VYPPLKDYALSELKKRATNLNRDKQQFLTVRPELVEGSLMVRQAHHERLNFKLSRLKLKAYSKRYQAVDLYQSMNGCAIQQTFLFHVFRVFRGQLAVFRFISSRRQLFSRQLQHSGHRNALR